VLTLALFIRTYFAGLLRNDIQAEAARTASVAQRVIEESDALLRRGAEGVDPVNDDVMIWLQQVIDQDVNIFDGPELVATSERDLFQSGLLPKRTPDGVFRSIALAAAASWTRDQIGTLPYLIAATPSGQRHRLHPLRAAGRAATGDRRQSTISSRRASPSSSILLGAAFLARGAVEIPFAA
jgi:hypothetical protein